MKRQIRYLLLLTAALSLFAQENSPMPSLYDFTVRDIHEEPVPLSRFRGRVLLIVNTASRCGFTPQYAGLEALYRRYKDHGFEVLAFPANNFLNQEPGSNEEIRAFCTSRFQITFPLFAKISVNGKDIHPLYAFLTSPETNPEHAGPISWNFNKFLIGRNGVVRARFGSRTAPDHPSLITAIEMALSESSPVETPDPIP